MGIPEALQELDGEDPSAFASTLQDEAPSFYKAIYTEGFGAGKSSIKSDLDTTEEKLESLKSERDKLQSQIEDLKGEQPEVAELRGKYEAKLEELQERLQAKENEVKEAQNEKISALKTKEQQFFHERAKNFLMHEVGVEDPDIADIKIQKAIQDGRVQIGDDLSVKVYEEDGEVPTPLGEKEPHEVFGESLRENIPDKFIRDPRPSSTNLGRTNGNTRGKTLKREQFEKLPPAQRKAHIQEGGEVVD